jgi:hypothetical protein
MLRPKQVNSGAGALLIGGSVEVNHHYNIHQIQGAPLPSPHDSPDSRGKPSKFDQSKVLTLLDQVPDRKAVLNWMQDTFETKRVIALDTVQLYRVRRYMEVILERQER